MRYSLIIPCYNEAASLPRLLERCQAVADARTEVILVDNGSSDDTPRILEDVQGRWPGCRAIRVEVNQGYGHGILAGLRAAEGDVLGWTHADLQTDPKDARRGFACFEQARAPERLFLKGRRYGRPVGDVVFTMGMALFESALLRAPLWDINAQPTLMHRRFFETWRSPPADFSLDLYAYYQARRQRLDVRRIPVAFGERAHGQSHWNVDWLAKYRFIKRTIDYSLALRLKM